ncbi:hypothetical protein F5Y16DRAFT_363880 [Xylariaceae sp. FL0255]|nr:hypothetical protein F5Y16DRAFT_363880 [Xylariaceae sp. FL0255]
MCGSLAEKAVLKNRRIHRTAKLEIRGHRYHLFLETSEANKARIFIRCPNLPTGNYHRDGKEASVVSEIIKCCAIVTRTDSLTPYFLQNSTVRSVIFRQQNLEKQGHPRMTTENLDPGIRIWLARKGFGAIEDIDKLERLAGCLTYGLILLFSCLPRKPRGTSVTSAGQLNDHRRREDISRETVKDTKAHCHDVIARSKEMFQEGTAREELPRLKTQVYTDKTACPGDKEDTSQQNTPVALQHDHPLTKAVEMLYHKLDNSPELEDESELSFPPELYREIEKQVASKEITDDSVDDIDDDMSFGNDGIPTSADEAAETATQRTSNRQYSAKPGSRRQTKFSTTPKAWRDEGPHFRGKVYIHEVPPTRAEGNVRQIAIWDLQLTIPNDLDIRDGMVGVSIETCAEGLLHPDRWATAATEQDIGGCLSFRITGKDTKGKRFAHIPRSKGENAVFRANSFIDILLHQASDYELVDRERRHVTSKAKERTRKRKYAIEGE